MALPLACLLTAQSTVVLASIWMRAVVVVVVVGGCGPVVGSSDGSTDGGASSDSSVGTTTTEGESSTSPVAVDSSESSGAGVDTSTTDVAEPCGFPPRGLTLLACGKVSSSLVADDGAAYAVVGGDLLRIAFDGATIDLLIASSDASGLVRDGGWLYWASFDDGEVGGIDLETGSATTFAQGLTKPGGIAADDAWVYVSAYIDEGTVSRIPTMGGPAEVMYAGLDHPGQIVRVGEDLYVVDSANDGNNPTPILRGSTDATPLVEIAEVGGSTSSLVAHDRRLYWAAYDLPTSALRSSALVPGAATESLYETMYQPLGMAISGDHIWWSEIGDMGNYSALRWWSMSDGATDVHVVEPIAFGAMVGTPTGVMVSTDLGVMLINGS